MTAYRTSGNCLRHRVILAGLLCAGGVSRARALPPAVDEAAAPPSHVLFVGTDLAVKQNGKYHEVVGANGDTLQIARDDGGTENRSIRDAEVRINRGVKLASLSASINNLRTENIDRAASSAQFEAMKASMMLANEAADGVDRLQGSVTSAGAAAVFYDPNSPDTPRGAKETYDAIQANKAAALGNFSGGAAGLESVAASGSTLFNDKVTHREPSETAISFEISSPEPLEHAYVVVVANYGSPPLVAHHLAAKALDRVDGRPQRVTLNQPALVAGRPMTNFDVDLFVRDHEIPTNLSAKRVPLTADQAYKYFLIEYLAAHPRETRAPTAILMTSRAEFRRKADAADPSLAVYFHIDKAGAILRASPEATGIAKMPPTLEAALEDIRFLPALQKGEPVEGRVKITLAELLD